VLLQVQCRRKIPSGFAPKLCLKHEQTFFLKGVQTLAVYMPIWKLITTASLVD
jgi:hypothetical protein